MRIVLAALAFMSLALVTLPRERSQSYVTMLGVKGAVSHDFTSNALPPWLKITCGEETCPHLDGDKGLLIEAPYIRRVLP